MRGTCPTHARPRPPPQEVVLPSGVRYVDTRIGGGQAPAKGLLVVLHYKGRADGQVFEDTRVRERGPGTGQGWDPPESTA
jgi:FKBP-type peptidyl-prolyl cis-trans isomerase